MFGFQGITKAITAALALGSTAPQQSTSNANTKAGSGSIPPCIVAAGLSTTPGNLSLIHQSNCYYVDIRHNTIAIKPSYNSLTFEGHLPDYQNFDTSTMGMIDGTPIPPVTIVKEENSFEITIPKENPTEAEDCTLAFNPDTKKLLYTIGCDEISEYKNGTIAIKEDGCDEKIVKTENSLYVDDNSECYYSHHIPRKTTEPRKKRGTERITFRDSNVPQPRLKSPQIESNKARDLPCKIYYTKQSANFPPKIKSVSDGCYDAFVQKNISTDGTSRDGNNIVLSTKALPSCSYSLATNQLYGINGTFVKSPGLGRSDIITLSSACKDIVGRGVTAFGSAVDKKNTTHVVAESGKIQYNNFPSRGRWQKFVGIEARERRDAANNVSSQLAGH